MKKKYLELKSYDWIWFPDSSAKWTRVFSVGKDTRKGRKGKSYVTIKGYGDVSLSPNSEYEVNES